MPLDSIFFLLNAMQSFYRVIKELKNQKSHGPNFIFIYFKEYLNHFIIHLTYI